MSCKGEATWFRDEFWRVVHVAVVAIGMMTIAYKISTALDKCTDEGEWRKSTSPAKKAEGMQIEACAITAALSSVSAMICRLRQTLATASCAFCTGNMGVTLITVFPSLWELHRCSSLPPQLGPGPLGMRSLVPL